MQEKITNPQLILFLTIQKKKGIFLYNHNVGFY